MTDEFNFVKCAVTVVLVVAYYLWHENWDKFSLYFQLFRFENTFDSFIF